MLLKLYKFINKVIKVQSIIVYKTIAKFRGNRNFDGTAIDIKTQCGLSFKIIIFYYKFDTIVSIQNTSKKRGK